MATGKIVIGDSEIGSTEWELTKSCEYVPWEMLLTGERGYVPGAQSIDGTFVGTLEPGVDIDEIAPPDMTRISLYGPATFGRVETVWRKILEAFGRPWPETLIAEGDGFVSASVMSSPDGSTRLSGDFRASGEWQVYSDNRPTLRSRIRKVVRR